MNGGTTDGALSTQEKLAALWETGRTMSLERVAAVETALVKVLTGQPVDLAEAVSAAHKLAGTLGMFGRPEGSQIAREIEHALEGTEVDYEAALGLAELAAKLRSSVESASEEAPQKATDSPTPLAGDTRTTLALIGPPRSYAEAIELGASQRGFNVQRIVDFAGTELRPADLAVWVVSDGLPERSQVEKVRQNGAKFLVAIGGDSENGTILRLNHLGFDLIVPAPIDSDRVLSQIENGTKPGSAESVFLIGGTITAAAVESALAPWSATSISPAALFDPELLPAASRSLVLVDISALPCDPVAFCAAVRRCSTTQDVHLVALIPDPDASRWLPAQLEAAGADRALFAVSVDATLRARLRWVVARSGRASTIELPVAPPEPDRVEKAKITRRSDGYVLLVEDDPLVTEVVSDLLKTEGYDVETVADGLAAAERLCDPQAVAGIRLAILDVSLPGLDGFGVLRRMQQSGTSGDVPIVLLTARSSANEIVEALQLGADDHVAKPFSPQVLLHRITRLLGNE